VLLGTGKTEIVVNQYVQNINTVPMEDIAKVYTLDFPVELATRGTTLYHYQDSYENNRSRVK